MKNFLYILTIYFLLFNNANAFSPLKCDRSIITVDGKYIYQNWNNGDVDKYKINTRDETYITGTLKAKSTHYDIYLDLSYKTLMRNSKDKKTGILGSFLMNCKIIN